MSMTTYVRGFRPPDEKWQRMRAVYYACDAAGVPAPEEVRRFFEYGTPDTAGAEVDINKTGAITESGDDSRMWWDVDIKKLPPDVTVVRFVNSY